jgi:hypothetical protein
MTPGSAVADELQNILARKTMQARQDQQDSLNTQNVQSQIRDRDATASFNKSRIDALNQDRAAQEIQRRAGLYSPGQGLSGEDLSYFQKNAPSLIDPGQEAQPDWSAEGMPDTPATGPSFHGLPAQLEKKRVDDRKMEIFKVLMDPKNTMTPQQKVILAHEAGVTLPENVVNPKDPEPWEPVYDAEGNDTGNWAPKGAHFTPKEPREPKVTVHMSGPVMEDDPTRPGQQRPTGKWFQEMSDGSMKYTDSPGHIGARQDSAGGKGNQKPVPLFDKGLAAKYNSAMMNKNKTPEAEQARTSARALFMGSITDDDVRRDVEDIINDPQIAGRSLADIMTMVQPPPAYVGNPVATQKYAESVSRLLRELGKK